MARIKRTSSSQSSTSLAVLPSPLIVIHIILIFLLLVTGILYYIIEHYGPRTYRFIDAGTTRRDHIEPCTLSTDKLEDLFIDSSSTPTEAKEQTETHGAAIIEDVLTKQTANELREYVLKANHDNDGHVFVKNNENRYHIMPSHREPTIQAALEEIGSHPTVRPLIDELLGPSASLVSMSVITSLYGAKQQDFHPDTSLSFATHPDDFVPEYTLAIPLQDTTKEMGATQICPGTQKCSDLEFDRVERFHAFIKDLYPNIADKEYNVILEDEEFVEWIDYNYPCNPTATLKAGGGVLYDASVLHRGGGYVDDFAEAAERVIIFITFAGSRQGRDDERSLPFGTVHSLQWLSWGHTIDDFITIKTQPWRWWHIFGLFTSKKSSGARPWTVQDNFWMIFRANSEAMHMISDELTYDYLEGILDKTMVYVSAITAIYSLLIPFAWMYVVVKRGGNKPAAVNKGKRD